MPPEDSSKKGLTPSDQLLGICAVNAIIVVWVGVAFVTWYDEYPSIPIWIYVAEAAIVVLSFFFSVLDAVAIRLINLVSGNSDNGKSPLSENSLFLKFAVAGFTVLYIFVLWRILEETGGLVSPFAPFLTAPALFAPFVTRNGWTIVALSLLVTAGILISSESSTLGIESTWPYKGTAAVMVLLAGLLTVIRLRVRAKGPLTGEGAD